MIYNALPHPQQPLYAWQRQTTWRMLVTDFGNGAHFLTTWAQWRNDVQRSTQLHYIAIADPALAATKALHDTPTELAEYVHKLAQALYGLTEGVHRISFEQSQVQLTLWIGTAGHMLRQQHSTVDAMLINAPLNSDSHSIKALARHCQRGTYIVAPQADTVLHQAMATCGFVWEAKAQDCTTAAARFDPHWEPRMRKSTPAAFKQTANALIIGAGLAGSSVAYSLAQRGWNVTVLAMGETPADGASGLLAGLFCPHVSPDDSVLSKLSRSGVRMTLQRLRDLCQEGLDWGHTGVLEHCTDGGTGLPASWTHDTARQWSQKASAAQLQAAGLPFSTVACWHSQAGWVRPKQLVAAQLQHPRIQFQGNTPVARIERNPQGLWCAYNEKNECIAQATVCILACGPGTSALLPQAIQWPLQALRGQITWGLHSQENNKALPPFPVNGNGNLVTHIPFPEGSAWVMGSTFERDTTEMPISTADQLAAHASNFEKLSTLLPASAPTLAPWFMPSDDRCQPTWGRVRCASHDRLPIAGPVHTATPHLWALTAMGARGLTLSVLCGELIAAQLHDDPLPLDSKLAYQLSTERLARKATAISPEI